MATAADLYLPTDLEEAVLGWGANCGPGALGALLGIDLAEVRQLLDEHWPGYTTVKAMKTALWRYDWLRPVRQVYPPKGEKRLDLSWTGGHQGLAFVQLEGPWERHHMSAQRHTHWVAWRQIDQRIMVYDVNLTTGILDGGWAKLAGWCVIVPEMLVEDEPRMTGWRWRSALVVE